MTDRPIPVAVIGAGAFGRNHIRVLSHMSEVELAAIVDTDLDRAAKIAADCGSQAFASIEDVPRAIEAAIVATPTTTHKVVVEHLLTSGIDVLVEKPVATTAGEGRQMADLADARGRILQVGHLERFNPAVMALEKALTVPLFFEVHRLSVFTPRSLDVDVILDLMIHDLDIVLTFTQELPNELRAAGISVLSDKVDIANVRLAFPSGCIANLTASRVSTERVRKLRVFQPGEYVSVDYHKQEAIRLAILRNELQAANGFDFSNAEIGFERLPVERGEPLERELASFFHCVRTREKPRVDARQASAALSIAEALLAKIKEHGDLVKETVRRRSASKA
ncbi:MAG: Gfo/Idh/MocA family oxidoreductase [Acidobacteriaceae bacterium]|nr:Gfo/Idh/MocA family oxidoreductase [Acidobacteriaceae bacterium]